MNTTWNMSAPAMKNMLRAVARMLAAVLTSGCRTIKMAMLPTSAVKGISP